MKVARFYEPGDICLEEIADPQVSAGEVKIRVRSRSTCGTDVKILRSGHRNTTPSQVMEQERTIEIVARGDCTAIAITITPRASPTELTSDPTTRSQ